MLEKIISGGQTGADRTALEVARELRIPTGGWCPRGCRTDDGPAPELRAEFGLIEHHSTAYSPRTRYNVIEADGTVLFGRMSSPGCRLTIKWCEHHHKPYLVNPTAEYLRQWLVDENIIILNVAGNRRRTNPGIVEHVRQVLITALTGRITDGKKG